MADRPKTDLAARQEPSDDIARLTRADLVATVEAYRAMGRSPGARAPIFGFLGGLLFTILVIAASLRTGWPDRIVVPVAVIGVAVAGASALIGARRQARLARDLQWHCVHCSAPMLPSLDKVADFSRAETAIATGRCPVCGESLFDP